MRDIFKTYEQFTIVRFKDGKLILENITVVDAEMAHACFGIVTELHELSLSRSHENTVEEIGDCLFYVQGFCIAVGIELKDLWNIKRAGKSTSLSLCGELLDLCKKAIFYNKDFDTESSMECIIDIVDFLRDEATKVGVTLEYCIRENMRKLTTRYPTGYSDQAAQARADKKEGEV
jgi:hypothetical protein